MGYEQGTPLRHCRCRPSCPTANQGDFSRMTKAASDTLTAERHEQIVWNGGETLQRLWEFL
jgi:hypothetical protein